VSQPTLRAVRPAFPHRWGERGRRSTRQRGSSAACRRRWRLGTGGGCAWVWWPARHHDRPTARGSTVVADGRTAVRGSHHLEAVAAKPARPASARLGPARLGPARLGPARLGSARPASARLGPDRPGSARPASARLASARLGAARLGAGWLGAGRLGAGRGGAGRGQCDGVRSGGLGSGGPAGDGVRPGRSRGRRRGVSGFPVRPRLGDGRSPATRPAGRPRPAGVPLIGSRPLAPSPAPGPRNARRMAGCGHAGPRCSRADGEGGGVLVARSWGPAG
jgi:hypothetical protein